MTALAADLATGSLASLATGLAGLRLQPAAAAMALTALACAGLAGYFALSLTGPQVKSRRLSEVTRAPRAAHHAKADGRDDRGRRRQIDETLKEMTESQQATARENAPTNLRTRLRHAGLDWSRGFYVGLCVACGGTVLAVGHIALGLGAVPSVAFAFASGFLLPHIYVARARASRFRAFLAEMPDALDVITRGVRSGLPLGDCLRGIAADGSEPLRTEFRLLSDDMALGLPLDDAMLRMAKRIPLLEVKLFGIILAIQNKTGGNLSEAIGNLSRVLRDRKKMEGKIKALSSEATASAAIIGALPILVLGLLYLAAPDYIGLLFSTQIGIIAMVGGGVWMLIGIVVMRGMIKIDI